MLLSQTWACTLYPLPQEACPNHQETFLIRRLMSFLGSSPFRLLLRPCSAKCFRSTSAFSGSAQSHLSTTKSFDRLNYNSDVYFEEASGDHVNYDIVTANDLKDHNTPPKRVKMLVRDFIEDSLYNPNYGYFPHQATIFTPSNNHIDFESLRDSVEFQIEVAKRYATHETDGGEGPGKQLWHTPTELFKVNFTFRKNHLD